jgi:hypothetical protein
MMNDVQKCDSYTKEKGYPGKSKKEEVRVNMELSSATVLMKFLEQHGKIINEGVLARSKS